MQRRIRQHHAQIRRVLRHVGRNARRARWPHQHDRRRGRRHRRRFGVGNRAIAARLGQRRHHHRERFFLAVLSLAQALDGFRVARVGQKLETADAFERENSPGGQRFGGLAQGRLQPWSARRARVRLRVEAAVARVGVLAPARRAHLELAHGGARPVVGNVQNDGVARPAVSAIGEGIKIAPVGRVEQLAEAVAAGCQVGQHGRGSFGARVAGQDLKPREAGRRQPTDFPGQHHGRHGLLAIQARKELLQRRFRPFDFHHQAGTRIQHPAVQRKLAGQPVNKRTKAHALHGAAQSGAHSRRSRAGDLVWRERAHA